MKVTDVTVTKAEYTIVLDDDEMEILHNLTNYFTSSIATLKFNDREYGLSDADAALVYEMYQQFSKAQPKADLNRMNVVR